MRKLIFLILIVPILTFSSGLKRISHYFGDSSIYAIMKSDDGYIFRKYSKDYDNCEIDEYDLFKKGNSFYTTEPTNYSDYHRLENQNIRLKKYDIEEVTEKNIDRLEGRSSEYAEIGDPVLKITEYCADSNGKFKETNVEYYPMTPVKKVMELENLLSKNIVKSYTIHICEIGGCYKWKK